jgi:hypothetical protein
MSCRLTSAAASSNRSPTSLDARLGFDLPFVIAGQVVVFE